MPEGYISLWVGTIKTLLYIFSISSVIGMYNGFQGWTRTLFFISIILVFLSIIIPILYEDLVSKFNYKIL